MLFRSEGHAMEARIDIAFLVPPSDCVGNMLGICAEVTIEFVAKI